MELDDFISGERLQGIADISIIPQGSDNGESECEFVKTQQKNNNYNVFYYNDGIKDLPEHVKNSKIIFINTWTLKKFFKNIFPKLNKKYIFISHNSDMGIDLEHVPFLNDKKIIAWFSQNTYVQHPKLFSLPIGLGNQQYNHGNLLLLKNIINKNNNKSNLIFKKFDISTNPGKRHVINNTTNNNKIFMNDVINQEDYFDQISKSYFCISPPGNGIDCHRIWESLYLKCIPIVEKNTCFNKFIELPIMFVDNWNIVTREFLEKNIINFKNYNLDKLKFSYWKSRILNYNIINE